MTFRGKKSDFAVGSLFFYLSPLSLQDLSHTQVEEQQQRPGGRVGHGSHEVKIGKSSASLHGSRGSILRRVGANFPPCAAV